MPDFDTSNIQDDDEVEITDLDLQNDSSSASLSLVLLNFARNIPLFASTRARSTMLALMVCAFMLLFLVQPGVPNIPGQTPRTSELASSSAEDIQSLLSTTGRPSTQNVTWIKTSTGKVIIIQVNTGTVGWHRCKVQHRSTAPNNVHLTVVLCT